MQHGFTESGNGINRPYLLVIPIPVYVDAQGAHWTDALWHKDLVRHLHYLSDFTIACPHVYAEPPEGFKPLDGYPIRYVSLARQGGRVRNMLTAPGNALKLWRAIAQADIVHSGVGSYNPLALFNLTFLISVLQKKYRLIIVESSTWRVLPSGGASLLKRWGGALSERINRACVSTAELSIFTQAEYKQSLLAGDQDRGHVIHASWIDDENIQAESAVHQGWQEKQASQRVRYLFAGRLEVSKGVDILLASIQALDQAGEASPEIDIDLIGEGPLAPACSEITDRLKNHRVRVRRLPAVDYGEPFFALLRSYSAVIVPSVGDEQPRVVYDAYSQGVPVIASATPGLMDCVEEGKTGRLFPTGQVDALVKAMRWGAGHRSELAALGLNGLARARAQTHGEMHRRRLRILDQSISKHFG